jgi:hypothetical protein
MTNSQNGLDKWVLPSRLPSVPSVLKEKKRKEKTTQTKSAWVKEVWMPQNLWEAVGPHYRGGGSAPFGDFSANSCFVGSLPFLA